MDIVQEIYLTLEGAVKLKAELEELKGPGREEMAKRLRSAIQMGDLSENADYHKAKEDQGFMEGRIQELEHLIKNAKIIDEAELPTDTIQVGSRVTVQEGNYPAETYFLVGATNPLFDLLGIDLLLLPDSQLKHQRIEVTVIRQSALPISHIHHTGNQAQSGRF